MKIEEIIQERAAELGFDMFGISPARRAESSDRFQSWLRDGMQAGMAWMARDPERRSDPRIYYPAARSIVSLGISYAVAEPPAELWDDPLRGRVARFAWGPDYHDVLKPRLKALAEFIDAELQTPARSLYCIDTSPVLERDFARAAGIGAPGYNGNIISPRHGSFITLGEVLVGRELEPTRTAESVADACAACRRCLAECPSGALRAPYVVDSRRCISYLTIENKGSIPEELRPMLGRWIFGCDQCQECCPQLERISKPVTDSYLSFDPDRFAPYLPDLLRLDQDSFRTRYRGTAIARIKRRGLLRNAAVALGNSAGGADARAALEAALRDEDEVIREHAAWALRALF